MATQLAKPRRDVRELLQAPRTVELMRALLPRHITPDRMMRLATIAVQRTPKLASCDPMTLLGAFLGCSALGLEPNTPLQHIFLIPFENRKKGTVEVQTVIGYRGYMELGRRSGLIRGVHADVVRPGDEFDFQYGTETFLKHKPMGHDGPADAYTHAYCHVRLDDGQAFVVMPKASVLAVRDKSQGYKQALASAKNGKDWVLRDNPWTAYPDRMARKTPIRQLFGSGEAPLSLEMAGALAIDERPVNFEALAVSSAEEIKEGISGFVEDEQDGPQLLTSGGDEAIDEETGEIVELQAAHEPRQEPKPARQASGTVPPARTRAAAPQRQEEPPPPADDGGDMFGDE